MKISPRKFGNSTCISGYTLDMIEQQLLQYFPSIQQKGYGLSLYYKADSFVEEVTLKVYSDGDLQVVYTGRILHELQ